MGIVLKVQGSKRELLAEGALQRGQALLELVSNGESPIPHSCRSAACGTCRVRVLSGAEALSDAEVDETDVLQMYGLEAPHVRLACQARLVRAADTVIVEVLETETPW
jgi:ferredoxin